jgi:hypothetical protein
VGAAAGLPEIQYPEFGADIGEALDDAEPAEVQERESLEAPDVAACALDSPEIACPEFGVFIAPSLI